MDSDPQAALIAEQLRHTVDLLRADLNTLKCEGDHMREIFETRMKALGVPTAVHYPLPLHLQPVFAHLGLREGRYPVSESAARRVVSLPMHPYLTEEQQVRVVAAVREAVG